MQSSLESSVSLYKKMVGSQRWESDEGIEKRAASTFADMCKVYGEENAIKMVRGCTCQKNSCFGWRDHDPPAPASGAAERKRALGLQR